MIEQYKQEFLDQWRDSQVLRLGCWGIGIILLLYAVLWLDDELTLAQIEWRQELAAVDELETLEDQAYWERRVERLQSQATRLQDQSWSGETSGLIKASLREFLTASLEQSDTPLELRNIEFGEPQPVEGDLWDLRGRFEATLDPRVVPWEWLGALERHERRFLIESMSVRVGSRRGVLITIEFRVPVMMKAAST